MDGTLSQERRSLVRRPGITIGPLRLQVDGAAILARVWDISIQGVGLLVDRPLEPETELTVVPDGPEQREFVPIVARVRHAKQMREGNWLLGCRFSRILTTNDMIRLG